MLSIKRHLNERILVGERYQVTVLEILADGLHRPGARLLVQTTDASLELWLYKGDRLRFDNGAMILELGRVGVGRVKLQVTADGLAIEWPKAEAPAPPVEPPVERLGQPLLPRVNTLAQLLSTIDAARAGGAL